MSTVGRRCWNCKHSNTCKDYSTFAFGCLCCESHTFAKAASSVKNLLVFRKETEKAHKAYQEKEEKLFQEEHPENFLTIVST